MIKKIVSLSLSVLVIAAFAMASMTQSASAVTSYKAVNQHSKRCLTVHGDNGVAPEAPNGTIIDQWTCGQYV